MSEAIKLLEEVRVNHDARFSIVNEGQIDESSLVATRDGYLNMIISLLQFLDAAERPKRANERPTGTEAEVEWDEETGGYWNDWVKYNMFQIPSFAQVWLVGAYLFDTHKTVVEFIDKFYHLTNPNMPSLVGHTDFEETLDEGGA